MITHVVGVWKLLLGEILSIFCCVVVTLVAVVRRKMNFTGGKVRVAGRLEEKVDVEKMS